MWYKPFVGFPADRRSLADMERRPNRPTPESEHSQPPRESGQYLPSIPVSKPEDTTPQPKTERARAFIEPRRSKSRDEAKAIARWYMQNRKEYTQDDLDKEDVMQRPRWFMPKRTERVNDTPKSGQDDPGKDIK